MRIIYEINTGSTILKKITESIIEHHIPQIGSNILVSNTHPSISFKIINITYSLVDSDTIYIYGYSNVSLNLEIINHLIELHNWELIKYN